MHSVKLVGSVRCQKPLDKDITNKTNIIDACLHGVNPIGKVIAQAFISIVYPHLKIPCSVIKVQRWTIHGLKEMNEYTWHFNNVYNVEVMDPSIPPLIINRDFEINNSSSVDECAISCKLVLRFLADFSDSSISMPPYAHFLPRFNKKYCLSDKEKSLLLVSLEQDPITKIQNVEEWVASCPPYMEGDAESVMAPPSEEKPKSSAMSKVFKVMKKAL